MNNERERIKTDLYIGCYGDRVDLESLTDFILSERKAAKVEAMKKLCENCMEYVAEFDGLLPDCNNCPDFIKETIKELTNEN